MEISEDMISLPKGLRSSLIIKACQLGLQVFLRKWVKKFGCADRCSRCDGKRKKDIETDYNKIVFEKNEVANVRVNKTDSLHRIAESVGVENIIFKIGPGIDAFEVAYWLIKEFGFEVSLENFNALVLQ